jgi:hypothetical protein
VIVPDYSSLWHWIREREAIRKKKEELRLPSPWTSDPILAAYRFCNVRREDDLVTRWVREHVRTPFVDHPLLWFMLCICRQVNWPGTLAELIETEGAWPSHVNFTPRRLGEALNARQERGEKIYTGAYMIPAPAEHGADKQVHIAEVVLGDLHRRAVEFGRGADWAGRTLQATHALIRRSSGWGPFLAYQAVVDMRFSERLLAHASDSSTWAAAGPGTLRGLNRLHGRDVNAPLTQEQALHEMRAIYEIARRETGVPMDFSDVPNVLCETDKYLRVQLGQGRPRAKYVSGRGA